MTDASLALPGIDPMSPRFLAAASFLANYSNEGTRKGYASDLRIYFNWCDTNGIDPMRAKRIHVQLFVRHLESDRGYKPAGIQRTITAVRCFYDTAIVDGYVLSSPCVKVKTPRIVFDPTTKTHLTRYELANLLRVARDESPRDWAMVHLLATIGMRVTAVCNVRIEDISQTPDGYRVLRTIGKNDIPSMKALPIPVAQAVDAAIGDRTEGWLLLRRDGSQMTRRSAGHRIELMGRKAGIERHLHPHALRTTHVTLALKSGVDLFVVQHGVDHSDPRTTLRYNALGVEIHGQASHTLAAMLASS